MLRRISCRSRRYAQRLSGPLICRLADWAAAVLLCQPTAQQGCQAERASSAAAIVFHFRALEVFFGICTPQRCGVFPFGQLSLFLFLCSLFLPYFDTQEQIDHNLEKEKGAISLPRERETGL